MIKRQLAQQKKYEKKKLNSDQVETRQAELSQTMENSNNIRDFYIVALHSKKEYIW